MPITTFNVQNPESGGAIAVKMDVPSNELWEYYLGGGSNCGISVTEEDSGFGVNDYCSTRARDRDILDHNSGALSDVQVGSCQSCGDGPGDCPQEIL